ncbi:DMT family transporter [Roseibium sp. SCP14]|uniref:DMT family transporter n=1 Tax=Roseibium sp. SCP14 TaxID=3141375 RepID=UPI003339639D
MSSLGTLQENERLVQLSPVVFLLLWASGFVFLKIGLEYADPFTFLALRYLCVVGLLLLLMLWLRPKFPSTKRGWSGVICVGLFLQTGYFTFTYLSLRHGLSAGVVALITCQQPILVGMLAPAVAGERVTPVRWVGLILGVTGASIVIVANFSTEISSIAGVAFGIAALMSITCSTLTEKRLATKAHPVATNIVQYSIGLIFTAPLAYFLEPMHITWSWQFTLSLAYLVLGASLLAITLLLAMIRRDEATRVSALFFLVPPTTALLAYVFVDETLAWISLPGMVLAAAGIFIVSRSA